jgi:hypothetical protein
LGGLSGLCIAHRNNERQRHEPRQSPFCLIHCSLSVMLGVQNSCPKQSCLTIPSFRVPF